MLRYIRGLSLNFVCIPADSNIFPVTVQDNPWKHLTLMSVSFLINYSFIISSFDAVLLQYETGSIIN